MSERNKPHNGRALDGKFRVRQADVDDLLAEPGGATFVRDDVRLGGAVADTGPHAGEKGEKIERLIEDNSLDVSRATGHASKPASRAGKTRGKGQGGYR